MGMSMESVSTTRQHAEPEEYIDSIHCSVQLKCNRDFHLRSNRRAPDESVKIRRH